MSFVLNRYVVGPLQENCYLIGDANTKEAVLIDPGEEADRLLKAINEADLSLKEVWLTHAHFDHIGALAEIVNDYGYSSTSEIHSNPRRSRFTSG